MDTRLFDEDIFRKTDITDISLTKNDFLDTKKRNAVVCERSNQKKDVQFLMEITVGKIKIRRHPKFNREELLASQMEDKVKEYEDIA